MIAIFQTRKVAERWWEGLVFAGYSPIITGHKGGWKVVTGRRGKPVPMFKHDCYCVVTWRAS